MRVPVDRHACHGDRWNTIRYALDSNARTIRLCLIWIAGVGPFTAAAMVPHWLPDLLSRL